MTKKLKKRGGSWSHHQLYWSRQVDTHIETHIHTHTSARTQAHTHTHSRSDLGPACLSSPPALASYIPRRATLPVSLSLTCAHKHTPQRLTGPCQTEPHCGHRNNTTNRPERTRIAGYRVEKNRVVREAETRFFFFY